MQMGPQSLPTGPVQYRGVIERRGKTMKTTLTALVLSLLSLLFFLWHVEDPPQESFDEIQYTSSARALLSLTPNPNPEAPPMGKLMIAVGIMAVGDNPPGWRVMSAVFGSITLAGVFLWVRLLFDDYAIAMSAAVVTLLNNFLYVFSRTAMMDIFLVGFLIWGLLGFTAAVKLDNLSIRRRRVFMMFAGTMFGLSCACKWNGVDTLGIVIGACAALLGFSRRSANSEVRRLAAHLREVGLVCLATALVPVPLAAYSASFLPLLHSLHQPFRLGELISMNMYIWRFHRAVVGNAFLITPWYTWPFRTEPLRGLSYLVGNWYVMWVGFLAVLVCARRFGRSLPETLIVALYAGNLLQWAITPQSCLYYYYYFPAAMFLGIAIPVALRQFPERLWGIRLGILSVVPAAVVFVFCLQRMAYLRPPFDCALGCWP
jgi:dolichyl-phosphate-mannose-protein mannosyltransferase